MVFGFEYQSEFIGTIRIVPIGYRLTLVEKLLMQVNFSEHTEHAHNWEVGRLVLNPEYRSDVDTLRHCLYLALNYASENAKIDNLYATCTHVLSRLYRRFGFREFARDVTLLGSSRAYTLIRGPSSDVLHALAPRNEPGATQVA